MLSLRRVLLLTCTLSLILASPTHTHPTGNPALPPPLPANPGPGPGSLLGRQYQLVKRDPLILLDAALDSALGSAKTNTPHSQKEPQKTTKTSGHTSTDRPSGSEETENEATGAAPPPTSVSKGQTEASANTNANTNTNANANTNTVAPRRMVPYSQYHVERRALEERRGPEMNYASRVEPVPHTQLPSAGDVESPQQVPDSPTVMDSSPTNPTSDILDAQDAERNNVSSGKKGQKKSGIVSKVSAKNNEGYNDD